MMNSEDKVRLRRQLLDWRDKHIDNIQHHLDREVILLYADIDKAFKKMNIVDIFDSRAFFKKEIEPKYLQWLKNETTVLLNLAQEELNHIIQHGILSEAQGYKTNLQSSSKSDSDTAIDAATATFSTGLAVAAIPSLITFSTTSVSAGGILGMLGATTTVISWPVAIVGGAVLLGLSHFGIGKFGSLKSDAIKRLRKETKKQIHNRVIQNEMGDSVCQHLQTKIFETTEQMIGNLKL